MATLSSRSLRVVAPVTVVVFVILAAATSKPERVPVLLSLGQVRGSVGVWSPEAGAWRQSISNNDRGTCSPMRVGADGMAEILFGQSRVVLRPGARATPVAPKGAFPAVKLDRGVLWAEVDPRDGPLEIQMPFGRCDLREGEAELTVEDVRASVRVVRGSAEVMQGVGEERRVQRVGPGESFAMSEGAIRALAPAEGPSPARRRPAAYDAEEGALGKLVLRDSLGREAEPLEVRELRVRARVLGSVALTEIEQTFFNPTERRAEGVFYFPVPAGAALCRFAMYVEGKLVEGELVERVRAREVYEEIVRRMQDPALMEWQEGNIFKTRIFPIPPRGPKRILISYTQTLRAVDGERRYVYPLVSKVTQASRIGRFEFDAKLAGLAPVGSIGVSGYDDASVEREGGNATVRLVRSDLHPTRDLTIRFEPARSGALELVTDRRAGEDGFFMLSYMPAVGRSPAAPWSEPRDTVLLFDTSLSRRADDYKAQLAVARTLLAELGSRDRFAVISFDVKPRVHGSGFASHADEIDAALGEIEQIVPLGATDMEAAFVALDDFLSEHSARGQPDVILIGDGIATLGETAPEKLVARVAPLLQRHGVRFHAATLGARHDRLVLSELARITGGLFRIMGPGDDVEREAFNLALELDSALLPGPTVEFSGVEVDWIYPARPGTLVAGEEMIVLGRYKSPGQLEVNVKQEGGQELRESFELPETDSRNVFIPRLWARERLDALMLREQTSTVQKDIIDLSQEFTLITPHTSFLVLENEEAYRTYGIDRRKRRRYWDEIGKLRTAPPPEEAPQPATEPEAEPPPEERQQQPSPETAAETEARPGEAGPGEQPEPEKQVEPRPFTLADLDLTLLTQRFTDGRELATALASICLEVYYRYLPVYKGTLASPGPAAPGALQLTESDREPAVFAAVSERTSPIQARDIETAPEEVGPPVRTDTTAEDLDALVAPSDEDRNTAEGQEDFLSDIPLGGSGVVGSIGIGGGGAESFGFRSGGGRRRAALRGGGSVSSENCVDATFGWLIRHQFPDGHWGAAGYEETGLSLLSLLGAGHTEKSGRHKLTVRRAVAWLIAQQKADGQIGPGAYEHAVATLSLSEAYGMARVPRTGAAAQKAVDRLIALQQEGGGWGDPGEDSHPLVTTWSVMALKSAAVAGLTVSARGFSGADSYLERIQTRDGAVGATGKPQGNEVHLLHTAAAMVCRQFMGYRRDDPLLLGAADLLLRHAVGSNEMPPDGMYLRYFGTLAMFQMGGEYWRRWNGWMRDPLIDSQRNCPDDPGVDGSWDPVGIWIRGRTPRHPQEGMRERIASALAEAAANPGDRDAYEALAKALSLTTDVELLSSALAEVPGVCEDIAAMVRVRLGLVHLQNKQHYESVSQLRAAYLIAHRPENILRYYLGALSKSGRASEGAELLLLEANEARTNDWRRRMTGTLLFEADVNDPVVFVSERLQGESGRHLELKVVLAQMAKAKGRHAVEARFFEQVYAQSGHDERYAAPLIGALRSAGRAPDALRLLMGEAAKEGRTSRWRIATTADLLLDETASVEDVTGRIAADLAARPKIRLAVYVRTAGRAEAAKKTALAAELWGRAYYDGGRLERHGKMYVRLLRACGRTNEARSLLVREARDDNRLSFWRMKSLAEMVLADPQFKEVPDRYADEAFGDRPRARIALKLELARAADASGNFHLAARLYEDVYHIGGRPVSLVRPYVGALLKSERNGNAATELESVIQSGFHTTWAFDSLATTYGKLERGEVEVLRAISSEVEMFPRDVQPHIHLAQHFEKTGDQASAMRQYLEAVRLKPEDPYFYRQVIERSVVLGRFDVARETLGQVLERWPRRTDIWGAGDEELLDLLNTHAALVGDADGRELERGIRRYLVKDLVVTMSWDTRGTDIDLHVTEPGGEECHYEHKETASGGTLDHDDTDGLGPETYSMRRVRSGKYRVDVVYYAGTPLTTVTVLVCRNRGGEDETVATHKVVLTEAKERVTVKSLEIARTGE